MDFKRLLWYQAILDAFQMAGRYIRRLEKTTYPDSEMVELLSDELDNIDSYLEWIPNLMTPEDGPKIKAFAECMEEGLRREGRIEVEESADDRRKGYLLNLLGMNDQYEALKLQFDSVRAIYAKNKWFVSSNRPDFRRHTENTGLRNQP
jgi:hypothetical protein